MKLILLKVVILILFLLCPFASFGNHPELLDSISTVLQPKINFIEQMEKDKNSWPALIWATFYSEPKKHARLWIAVTFMCADKDIPTIGFNKAFDDLLRSDADINAREVGWTPLMWSATFIDSAAAISALLEAGADKDLRDDSGRTALFWAAAWNRDPEVISVLLEAGSDVNVKCNLDATPLMAAALMNQNPEVFLRLLKGGADLNSVCKHGKTALDYAKLNEHMASLDLKTFSND